jgi:hypothetical protein
VIIDIGKGGVWVIDLLIGKEEIEKDDEID